MAGRGEEEYERESVGPDNSICMVLLATLALDKRGYALLS